MNVSHGAGVRSHPLDPTPYELEQGWAIFDDGEGHYIFTFAPEGHNAYNASRFELVDLHFLIFLNWYTEYFLFYFILKSEFHNSFQMHLCSYIINLFFPPSSFI